MRNKKLYITMLILAISFLVGMYVIKIFFPQEFMMAIQDEKIIMIGDFIDSHIWLRYLCSIITSSITYYLYCCACCHRFKFKWYELLYILITSIAIRVVYIFDANISTAIQFASFIFLPALMDGDLKTCALVASTHYLAQCLMLTIRNLPMYLTTMNYVTVFFMTLDCYLWLILYSIIFNYKKETK